MKFSTKSIVSGEAVLNTNYSTSYSQEFFNEYEHTRVMGHYFRFLDFFLLLFNTNERNQGDLLTHSETS